MQNSIIFCLGNLFACSKKKGTGKKPFLWQDAAEEDKYPRGLQLGKG